VLGERFEGTPAPVEIVQDEDEKKDSGCDEGDSEDGVGEAAMMCEPDGTAAQVPEHVNVGGFGRKNHGYGCERGLAGEPGTTKAGAVKEVGDGFQGAP
jgi:hypothetical protein